MTKVLVQVGALFLLVFGSFAQDALRYSLTGDTAAEKSRQAVANQPYTIKSGDFRLSITPSLGLDYNDNINLVQTNQLDDIIIRPMVDFAASYPLTQHNLLQLNIGVGYNEYVWNHQYSQWYIRSGSQLGFDIYVKDFWINLHDRFSYTQDSAQQGALAATGNVGTFQNTIGETTTWDLEDLVTSLGYDHLNYLSTTASWDYTDHTSEMFLPKAGFKLNPALTTGIEGTVSITDYSQPVLNNSIAYSAGVYGTWLAGSALEVDAHVGYSIYDFEQTSLTNKAQNANSWYVDLIVSHHITKSFSYNIDLGHEIRLGLQTDSVQDTFFRPGFNWELIKNLTLGFGLFYEHGIQSTSGFAGIAGETYDHYGGSLSLSHAITKKLALALNYRLTFRASDESGRDYTQNQVGLLLTYTPQ